MKTVKLGDVCEFRRGLTYKKTDEVSLSNNIVLRANNINLTNFRLNFDELKYISETVDIHTNKYLIADSILICTASGSKSHLGKVAYIDQDYPYAFGGFMGLIVPKREVIDGKFLYKILISKPFRDKINELMDGANINNLKFKDIEDFALKLPSLDKQKKIVDKLDGAFEKIDLAIELTQKNLQNSQKLFDAIVEDEFSSNINWTSTKLDEAYDVRDGTHDSPKYHTEGYPLVTSKNLKNHTLDMLNVKLISKEDYESINKRSGVNIGDVLFAMIGTIGNPVVVETEPGFAIKNVALFKQKGKNNPYFLKYYLASKTVIEKMSSEAKGSTQKFVGLGYLRNFPINLPSVDIQGSIVSNLDKALESTQSLRNSYQLKLNKLEQLKQSMLQEAFQDKAGV